MDSQRAVTQLIDMHFVPLVRADDVEDTAVLIHTDATDDRGGCLLIKGTMVVCNPDGYCVDPAIEQRVEPGSRRNLHMVIAIGADVQIVRQFAMKQHGSALIALGPQVFGHFAARKQRVDAGADVIRDPVHGDLQPLFALRDKPQGREMQSAAQKAAQ